MNYNHFEAIEAAIKDEVHRRIEDIPGPTIINVVLERTSQGLVAVMNLNAWGPTLHARRLEWRQNLPAAMTAARLVAKGLSHFDADIQVTRMDYTSMDADLRDEMPNVPVKDIASAFAEALHSVLTVQHDLHAEAMRQEIRQPLANVDEMTIHIGHVRVSKATLDILVERLEPMGALSLMRTLLADLIEKDRRSADDRLRSSISARTQTMEELYGVLDFGAACHQGVPEMWLDLKISEIASYEGTHLKIDIDIPHMILQSADGYRIADLVKTGQASLDDLLITEAHQRDEGGFELWVERDDIRVIDHPVFAGINP